MAADEALVKVEAHVGPSVVLKGVRNQVHVSFETITGEPAETIRPPVDLCLVLDRSGSMSSKNKMKTAKSAIKGLVKELSVGDRLALVVYDSVVSVVMDFDDFSVGKDTSKICAKIDRIQTQGCTNLQGGLKRAFELFQNEKSNSKKGGWFSWFTQKEGEEVEATTTQKEKRNQKIFLFSDGLVNEGETNSTKICNFVSTIADAEITVDSFGIGDDFNEDLMQNIGEYGCGRFHFIESSEAMEQFVSFALKGILRLVARQAVLKVRGAGPSIAEKVFDGDLVQGFAFHDLTAKNSRGVLVEVSCSPAADESRDRVDLLTWELTYNTTDGEPVTLTGTLDVTVTEDDREVVKSKNPDVSIALLIRKSVEVDEKSDSLLEQGKRDEAVKLKEELLGEMDELSLLKPDDVKLKALLVSQKRSIQELKDSETSIKMNQKINKKNKYWKRRLSISYCQNDLDWETQNLKGD